MNLSFVPRLILAAYLLSLGWSAAANDKELGALYDEPYRSQFHFTPPKNWMNDPNGPVYYEGEYHLFYQYNPFGSDWGHMSWGHAISHDLVHWQHLPVALPEENGAMAFSGSTVVDRHNSSGLCKSAKLNDSSCLIAVYTAHTGTRQMQNLAYSYDKGRSWIQYSGNPIIDLGLRDFRDPKVFWHEPSHHWTMVVALPTQHKVRFFASLDLKRWVAVGDFGPAGATGGKWECPDLFELPVDGEPGQSRWVLSINLNPGGIAGGSGNQYFVGRFDGRTFASENPHDDVLWADYGKDFYASTSFANMPGSDDRRIWLGWLDNWQYAAQAPTFPWRGTQSFPRALKLKRFPQGIRMLQEPIAELSILRSQHTSIQGQSIDTVNRFLTSQHVDGDSLEIVMDIDLGSATEIGLKVRKGRDEETVIGVKKDKSEIFVDRTMSGKTDFNSTFPGRHAATIHLNKHVKLHVLVDRQSVEVFANDGEAVISDCIFPRRTSQAIELYSNGGEARISELHVWKLRSVWQ